MIKIQAENLLPGMQLAKPVMNKAGIVLFSKGTELTEAWIRRIQDMELGEAVWVEGKEEMEIPMEEMLAAVEKRFQTSQGNPRMDLIKRVTERHIRGLYE